MRKISGLLGVLPVLLLSSCSWLFPSSDDATAKHHEQPYWTPPAGIFSPNAPSPAPPPSVKCLRPGMSRAEAYACLRRGGAQLIHKEHPRDARCEDWQEFQLVDGHLDVFFKLHSSPAQWRQCDPISPYSLERRPKDELMRFRYTNRENWVLWWGVPGDDPVLDPCTKLKPCHEYKYRR
jgi:hypothetical protein